MQAQTMPSTRVSGQEPKYFHFVSTKIRLYFDNFIEPNNSERILPTVIEFKMLIINVLQIIFSLKKPPRINVVIDYNCTNTRKKIVDGNKDL
jgi:hypothetical protein